ncbi:MAG: hypothetical protein WB699_11880, partial [Bacteroidota bacterium]
MGKEIQGFRFSLVLAFALSIAVTSPAQEKTGISPSFLKELRASCPDNNAFRASRNALSQTDGRKI